MTGVLYSKALANLHACVAAISPTAMSICSGVLPSFAMSLMARSTCATCLVSSTLYSHVSWYDAISSEVYFRRLSESTSRALSARFSSRKIVTHCATCSMHRPRSSTSPR